MTLAELMDQKGLSIKELAKKPGCSESTIKRALKGENLNATSKEKMAAGLEVSIVVLSESIKAQLPQDPIAKLVDETIQKLKILGLEFKPPKDNSNADIPESIRQDLCGGESPAGRRLRPYSKQAALYCQQCAVERLSSWLYRSAINEFIATLSEVLSI